MPGANVNWPNAPLVRQNPWYPGQVGGVPGTASETGLRLNTEGCIFYVDPNHPDPNDNRDGTDPTSPLATIDAAVGKCEAYRGDIIVVMHNGFWTYGDPGQNHITPIQEAVTLDVPGIRIVGVSTSSLGVPWIPSAANQTLINITQCDTIIEGFCFWETGAFGGCTAIAAQWNGPPYGENLTVRHCYFYNLGYGIQLDYAWNCYIEGCRFEDMVTAAIHNPSVYGEPDYLVIRDNVFLGNAADINLPDCDQVLIEGNRFFDVTAAIAITNGDHNQILSNVIDGAGGGAANMINLTGGSDNVISDNTLSCTLAEYGTTCEDATSGSWGFNHCEDGDTVAAP